MKLSANRGSTPLELVLVVTLLLLSIAPMANLTNQLNHELAAESIARNALRLAVLRDADAPERAIPAALVELANNWKVQLAGSRVWCTHNCELISLEVRVGNATAIHTMGREP